MGRAAESGRREGTRPRRIVPRRAASVALCHRAEGVDAPADRLETGAPRACERAAAEHPEGWSEPAKRRGERSRSEPRGAEGPPQVERAARVRAAFLAALERPAAPFVRAAL